MTDSYSFTKDEAAKVNAGGLNTVLADRLAGSGRAAAVVDATRRGDNCEAEIMAGKVAAADVPVEVRRSRSMIETMASAHGRTPWHMLPEAKVLDGEMDSLTALRESGLDWKVEALPVVVEDESKRSGDDVPAQAIVRETDRRVLGASGVRYTPVQNETLFAVGDALVKTGHAKWETAGSMRGGRRVWALLSLEDSGEVAPGDVVKSYILISNSHDGSTTADIALTTVRVVCNNSFRLAMKGEGASTFKFKHTTNVETRLVQAGEILLTARERFEEFKFAATQAALLKLGEQAQVDYLVKALGIDADPKARSAQAKTKLEVAKACLREERRIAAEGVEDSAWTAFNAITRYTSHEATVRDGGSAAVALERRMEGAMWSAGAETNDTAFDMVLAMTEAAAGAR